MSEENAETYRHLVDAWNQGDIDEMLAFASEDAEIVSFLIAVEGGYRGHEGVRRWWEHFHDAFPDWHAEIVGLRSSEDVTVARLRVTGHGRESGAPVDQVLWHMGRWRNGKVVHFSAYRTESEALEAAGLSE